MRLRVRDASNGRTWRMQLDQSSPTIHNLKDSVIQQCFASEESPSNGNQNVLLSLNKKEPIQSDPDATLSSLGICSGDLIWLLSPVPPPVAPTATTATARESTMADQPVVQPAVSQQREEQPMDIDPEEGPSTSSQQLDGLDSYIPVPVGLRIPSYLLRVLTSSNSITKPDASSSSGSSFVELGPIGVLLLMAHAAMLETGFTYISNSNNNTATTASSVSYINQMQDNNHDDFSDYHLSIAAAAISSGVFRLQYNLASNKEVSASPACTLICSAMGESVLIAASAEDGKHARHVVLDWKAQRYVVPYSTSKHEEKKNKGVGKETESLKLCDGVEITPRQDIILLAQTHNNVDNENDGPRQKVWKVEHEALKKVWNILKDSIALPMLTAACLSAGYPPPVGLLTLPTEVKDSLLGMLCAIDLAALGAACTELKHLTSSDELWKPLFLTDFPDPPVEIAYAALKKGYKWAYAHCFLERRRAEEERYRRRQRRYVIPGLPLGPRPPYYPAPAPRGFPGIIGGDQDRLPFFPGPPGGRFTFGGGVGSRSFGSGSGGRPGSHRLF
ncbi:hypothetical protein Ndes2526B_g02828 [Nannochloris sp. 'desiccata']